MAFSTLPVQFETSWKLTNLWILCHKVGRKWVTVVSTDRTDIQTKQLDFISTTPHNCSCSETIGLVGLASQPQRLLLVRSLPTSSASHCQWGDSGASTSPGTGVPRCFRTEAFTPKDPDLMSLWMMRLASEVLKTKSFSGSFYGFFVVSVPGKTEWCSISQTAGKLRCFSLLLWICVKIIEDIHIYILWI